MKNGHDSQRIQEMTDEERAWYLAKLVPDVILLTLADLLASDSIIKIGGGRYTKYIWNRDKE